MPVIQKEDILEQDVIYKVILPEMESYIAMYDHPEYEMTVQTDGTLEGTSVKISRGEQFKIDIDMVHVSVNPEAHREMQEAINHRTDIRRIKFRATYPFSDCKEIWELLPNGVFQYEFGRKGVRTNYVIDGNSFSYQKNNRPPCQQVGTP